MKYKVLKYRISPPPATICDKLYEINIIETFEWAQHLHVQYQNDDLHVWLKVDVCAKPVKLQVLVIATGEEIPNTAITWMHIGTVVDKKQLVWHVFISA